MPFALAIMAASGFAALGYQIVWTQQAALWLGHEAAAVLAVVTAFFAGLAVGAFAFGAAVERSPRPARWYAACEFVIAAWSLLLAFAMAPISHALLHLAGVEPSPFRQWAVAFLGTFLTLLPATAAMGATLPALERATVSLRQGARSIAALYASNTGGAVLGVLAIAFWLAPAFGFLRTAGVCVVLNLFCGMAALALLPKTVEVTPRSTATPASGARAVLVRLAVTGLLGIGYEVVVVRVLSQVAEDTVYTFAMLLVVYLLGTAGGAALYTRGVFGRPDDDKTRNRLLCALATACLLGTACLWGAERLRDFALHVLGPGMTSAIAAEAALAVVAFGPAPVVMGALFSHLGANALASRVSFGRALGVNLLGAAIAPVFFGVLLYPALGPKFVLLIIGAAYLLLVPWRGWLTTFAWAPAFAALLLAVFAPALRFIDVRPGGRVVSYADGVMASVSVVEDTEGVRRLRIDNREQEGSNASVRVDSRQGWLPLLLHPNPRRALFLGLGTGITASAAARDAQVEVTAVELLPEVIAASDEFTGVLDDGAERPHPQFLASDARRFVRATDRSFDVIVSDNFHPARNGSGSLYTVEHFRAVRLRLAPGGVFCQWLPLHQLDLETLRSIVQSFLAAFPRGSALLASNSLETPVLGLIGRQDDGTFDAAALSNRLVEASRAENLAGIGFEDEFAVLGSFVAGPGSLRRFAGAAEINSDDHPVVAYRAPRITYAPDSLPRDRLIALLAQLTIAPADIVSSGVAEKSSNRLAAYWQARNRFIVLGRDVKPSRNLNVMLAQVRGTLLGVLRVSPDFRPAYDPLLNMATALAAENPGAARDLLRELERTQPARGEASDLLAQLDAPAN